MEDPSWFKSARGRLRGRLHRLLWGSDIHPSAIIDPSAYVDRTWPKGVHIGAGCRIGSNAIILSHDMIRGLFLDTRVGAGTVFEPRAIVMPGVSIGAGCIVAERSVVTRDVPDHHRAEGNPARAVPLAEARGPSFGLTAPERDPASPGASGRMHVAICIVGFRNPLDIEECLRALARSTYEDFEVIICENGGRAAFDELVRRTGASLPRGQRLEVVLAETNLGYAGGVNTCIRKRPDADAWWILNPDTQPHPNALAELVGTLTASSGQMIGGTVIDQDNRVSSYGGRWRSWLARSESIGLGSDPQSNISRQSVEADLSYISGASLIVDREFIGRAGLMREDYFLYGEEVEWALRGLERGLKLRLAPNAVVLHKEGTTTASGGDIRKRPKLPIYLDERNKILITRDHFPWRMIVAAPAALVLIVLRYGRRGAWRQLSYGVHGWAAGLMNRRGPPAWLPQ